MPTAAAGDSLLVPFWSHINSHWCRFVLCVIVQQPALYLSPYKLKSVICWPVPHPPSFKEIHLVACSEKKTSLAEVIKNLKDFIDTCCRWHKFPSCPLINADFFSVVAGSHRHIPSHGLKRWISRLWLVPEISFWHRLSSLFSVSLLMELCKHRELLGTAKSRPRCKSLPTPFLTNGPNYPPGATWGALIFIEESGSALWAGELGLGV